MRHFEDFEPGQTRSFGEYTVSQTEIIEFAEQFDPQPFHTDPGAAAETPFGGVVASGWHTASLTMRLLVAEFLSETETHGALGVDELRWRDPLRPGDTISVRTEVLDTGPWSDAAGLVTVAVETLVEESPIMTMESKVLFGRREPL